MTLIDHDKENEYVYPLPPIFETEDVLPVDLIRGPKGGANERGPKGDATGPNDGGPEDVWREGPGSGSPDKI